MKKLLAIILTMAMALCVAGCGGTEEETCQVGKQPFSRTTYDMQGTTYVSVIVDHETGVNYVFYKSGYSGVLSPRYNADGTLYITDVQEYAEDIQKK